MTSARDVACATLKEWEFRRDSLRDQLSRQLAGSGRELSPRDRAFCRDLVYGAVSRLNAVDWAVRRHLRRPEVPLSPESRAALRLGAYQLLYETERIPVYAAVGETVGWIKRCRPREAAFVNGILRELERQKARLPWPVAKDMSAAALSLRETHPQWLVQRWLARWGAADAAALLHRNNSPAPLTLRIDPGRADRDALIARLEADGQTVSPSSWTSHALRVDRHVTLGDLPGFASGAVWVQDESSQLAGDLLAPEPGERVWDVCAGQGGKTLHLAAQMEGRGRLVATDPHGGRRSRLRESAGKMQIMVEVENLTARAGAARWPARMDRVLVDAPCSGLGVCRRQPDIRWNRAEADVTHRYPGQQLDILTAAAGAVRPGGVLVYAVCTFEREETDGVVARFLDCCADFALELPAEKPWLDIRSPDSFGMLLLPHRHDTDGFYMTRLRRRKDSK